MSSSLDGMYMSLLHSKLPLYLFQGIRLEDLGRLPCSLSHNCFIGTTFINGHYGPDFEPLLINEPLTIGGYTRIIVKGESSVVRTPLTIALFFRLYRSTIGPEWPSV
ncbi:hypothetical protein CEXT_205231 [Caerostris extrusa]|uniref:Uncharacterized protein n=1 Tax=Caerostris extrusa TaxID=172846 RepID=A0AAV4RV98_CAEEX|nr:hypothetical protein CEXT_205231 [Caerostris extrusa]